MFDFGVEEYDKWCHNNQDGRGREFYTFDQVTSGVTSRDI